MNVDMLDVHVLPRAGGAEKFDLNRESLQQAARRRSQRRDAPIDSAFPSRRETSALRRANYWGLLLPVVVGVDPALSAERKRKK
jgi:hypothetical protein